jgi:hypothetical protein
MSSHLRLILLNIYPLFKSWIKDTEYLLLIVVRTGLEPVPRGDSLNQSHKVITPCFTCHVTLRGHSMLPKVSYDHLTPMSSHQYVFSIDLSATCTDACPKQRLGSQDRIRTCNFRDNYLYRRTNNVIV